MTNFVGKDLHVYFTWVPASIGGFVHRSQMILSEESFDEEMKIGANQVYGGTVVTLMARMEKELNKQNGQAWPGIRHFYGEEEFKNFYLLRHCFAHAGGYILNNRKVSISAFLEKLSSGRVCDHERKSIIPYFSINEDEIIILERSSITRLSILCKEVLALNGLIEKSKVHSNIDW